MITAFVSDASGNLVYTIDIHAELYLAIILGALTAFTFFHMLKN